MVRVEAEDLKGDTKDCTEFSQCFKAERKTKKINTFRLEDENFAWKKMLAWCIVLFELTS